MTHPSYPKAGQGPTWARMSRRLESSMLQGLQRGKCDTETKLHSRRPFTVVGCVQYGGHPVQSEVHAGCEGESPGKEEEEEEQLEQPVPALLL
jgi:hypothetical protein